MTILARWLRRLADWLDPPDLSAIDLQARAWVLEADGTAGSGEYKRHTVYARLIKAFPAESRRRLSLAIERAMGAL